MTPRPYFTLATRDDGKWSPQFGDYSRAVVAQESTDSYSDYRRADKRIITSGDSEDAINAAIAALKS